MRTTDRLKLDAARRVLDFYSQNPEPDPSPATVAALTRLQEQLARAESALEENRAWQQGAVEALAERDAITDSLRPHVLSLLRLAAFTAEHEGLADMRDRARLTGMPRNSLAAIELAVEIAHEYQELLLAYGMPRDLQHTLREGLKQYREADSRRVSCLVAALAVAPDASVAAREAHLTIRHLDALKRLCLASDPSRLSAWRAACTVRWRPGEETDGAAVEAS